MPITLQDRIMLSVGDTDMVTIDATDYLDDGELIASITSVVDTDSVLTIGNVVVSTANLTVKGRLVLIGKALQFKVSGQLAGVEYRVRMTFITDGTPPRTAVRDVLICGV